MVPGAALAVLFAAGVVAGAPALVVARPGAVPPAPEGAAAPPVAVVRYSAPVVPVSVVRGFEPPPTPYAAGHRGVDLAVTPGQSVAAAADGVVSFAGDVAGRGVVVIASADGIRTEYEPVAPSVRAGAAVVRGQQLGVVAGTHGSCAPGACLHWGARRGAAYLDPLGLIAAPGQVRLVPWPPDQARGCACPYTARSRSTETWV